MCGIAGIVSAADGPPPDRAALERAVEALHHRGPDGSGVVVDGPVALGHTRLAIIDVEGGAQPLPNEDGTVVTIYNGEIWNHVALRQELERAGHVFRTRCDSEVLVHGYEEWGDDFVRRLHGMFAFAIWDAPRERLLLARDAAGKKPLYVRRTETGIVFASDARAALLASGRAPELDPDGLAAFLFQRYTVAPRSLFRGVERLRPGHLLVFDRRAGPSEQAYWQLRPPREPVPLEPTELRALLAEAVRERLMSDVPLGVLLSGGVDSAAVLGLARSAGAEQLDTFTIGFADTAYDERDLARLSAAQHGARHHEVVVDGRSFAATLPRLAWYRDEPVAEPSEIPLLLLAEFAAKRVKVVLGGDAGDELFGGYPKYRAERLLRALGPLRSTGAAAARLRGRGTTHRRLDRAVETLAVRDELARWASWFRSFSPSETRALLVPSLAAHAGEDVLYGPLRQALEPYRDLDAARRMLLGDFHTYLADNMLLRTDKVLMAASLEGRVPLLDRAVVDRVSAAPARDRFGWRTGKTLLRAAVRDLVPEAVLTAPKRGFPVPVARLLREGEGGALERMLLSERTLSRGLLRPDAVRELVSRPAAPSSQQELKLFTLISLELWLRANVDRVTLTPPESLHELLDEPAAAARRPAPIP
jgi:asparagine synthase (glutamine-hydrolysing)